MSGQALSDHLVHTIFVLFDSNGACTCGVRLWSFLAGDGELDDKEFIKIMKDASARGLNRVCMLRNA